MTLETCNSITTRNGETTDNEKTDLLAKKKVVEQLFSRSALAPHKKSVDEADT